MQHKLKAVNKQRRVLTTSSKGSADYQYCNLACIETAVYTTFIKTLLILIILISIVLLLNTMNRIACNRTAREGNYYNNNLS